MGGKMILKAYRQESGLVSVRFPSGDYRCDGRAFRIESCADVLVAERAKIERLNAKFNIFGYTNPESGEEISAPEYTRRKAELEGPDAWDSDLDRWKSIHARHTHEIFCASWTPVYESQVLVEDVELEILGDYPNEGNAFVIPVRRVGGRMSDTLFNYYRSRHAAHTATEELKRAGLEVLDNPDKIKFFKFFTENKDGHRCQAFLTIEISSLRELEKPDFLLGTKSDMLDAYYSVDDLVRRSVRAYANRKLALKDTTLRVGSLSLAVEAILSLLRKVRPRKSSIAELGVARDGLEKLLDRLDNAAASPPSQEEEPPVGDGNGQAKKKGSRE